MYVSAWLLTIPWLEASSLVAELQDVSFNISIVSLIALVSVCVCVCVWSYVFNNTAFAYSGLEVRKDLFS